MKKWVESTENYFKREMAGRKDPSLAFSAHARRENALIGRFNASKNCIWRHRVWARSMNMGQPHIYRALWR